MSAFPTVYQTSIEERQPSPFGEDSIHKDYRMVM